MLHGFLEGHDVLQEAWARVIGTSQHTLSMDGPMRTNAVQHCSKIAPIMLTILVPIVYKLLALYAFTSVKQAI